MRPNDLNVRMETLYEDDHVIVINKPAGLATQTANVSQPDCVSLLKGHIKRNSPGIEGEPYVGIVHRLDQSVAGLLVFAKSQKAAASLSRQVQNGLVNKHYIALVEGVVDAPSETELCDIMYRDAKSSRAVIADSLKESETVRPAGRTTRLQEARLYYKAERVIDLPVPGRISKATVLTIRLETGRFHQIRAQLSHMGHPVVGDRKYGAVTSYPDGIALIADRLEFIHPVSGGKIEKIIDFSFVL